MYPAFTRRTFFEGIMQAPATIVVPSEEQASYRFKLMECTARAIGADALIYRLFTRDKTRMKVQWGVNLPDGFRTSGRLEGRIGHHEFILEGKRGSIRTNLPATAFWKSDPDLKRHAWRSYLATAVEADGRTVGCLEAYSMRAHGFREVQLNLLELAAAAIPYLDECTVTGDRRLRREQIMTGVCTHLDAPLPPGDCLQRCLEAIGTGYGCDAASLYLCRESPEQISPTARWSSPDRRTGALDAHVGSLLAIPAVAARGDNIRFFCWSDDRQAHHSALRNVLRASKTLALTLMVYDREHAPPIVFALQDAGGPRRWETADIRLLTALMRVFGLRLRLNAASRRLAEVKAVNAQIVQSSPTAVYSIDLNKRRFISMNEAMCQATGYSREELAAMDPGDLLTSESRRIFGQRLLEISMGRAVSSSIEFQLRTKSGNLEWGYFHIHHRYVDGRIGVANVVAHIVTEQKKAQEALARYGRQLEALVEARTGELSKTNRQLRREIEQHTRTAAELRKQSERLTEMNTAMRVILDKRNEERMHTEENIRATLKEMIEPHLQRLESSMTGKTQQQLIGLIRMNLEEVAGSPLPKISSVYLHFSPSELQIVNLIRKGRTTKQMAALLNISPRTVEAYRNTIRKKLGLKNRKINLKAFLSSFK